jgi:hypothetical protein
MRITQRVLSTSLLVVSAELSAQVTIPLRQLREELRIVSDESKDGMQLTPIMDATVLEDGRIVTAHGREAVLRVFGADGKLQRVLGRRGSGPGEFRDASQVGDVGQAIWAYDGSQRRITQYGPDLALTSQIKAPSAAVKGGISLLGLPSSSTSIIRTYADPAYVAVHDKDGNQLRRINATFRQAPASFTVNDVALDPSGQRPPGSGPTVPRAIAHPLTTFTSIALAPGAKQFYLVESAEIWGGKSGQLQIQQVAIETGMSSGRKTVTLPARQVSSSERDSLLDRAIKREPRLSAQVKSRAVVPAQYPAFRGAIATRDGVLWLGLHGADNEHVIVDANGVALMRVHVPVGLRVIAASRSKLWGILRDDDDLPIIVRYALVQ